jgi:uncharacterized protein (TIGR02996 family)
MTEQQAFLQAIFEEPDDDAPRLIYADWLEERGDPRAEFIRVGCALAGLTREDPRFRLLWTREGELIRTHKEKWFGPTRKEFSWWDCHRGFLDEVATGASVFLKHADELFRAHAVQRVKLSWAAVAMPELVKCPHLARVETLDLSANSLEADELTALASANLVRLTALNLNGNRVQAAGLRAILSSTTLTRLTRLDLAGRLTYGESRTGSSRRHIANIGNEGVAVLATSPGAARLTQLDLSNNTLRTGSAMETLATSPYLTQLQTLVLSGNEISGQDQERLRVRFGSRVVF